MPKNIKIIRERLCTRVDGNKLSYLLNIWDGKPKYHYDKTKGRLEVFLLHDEEDGDRHKFADERFYKSEFELPSGCKEVRFTTGSLGLYEKLEKRLIDRFVSKSENYSRK